MSNTCKGNPQTVRKYIISHNLQEHIHNPPLPFCGFVMAKVLKPFPERPAGGSPGRVRPQKLMLPF